MPTTYLKEVSMMISDEVSNYTDKALLIHQYQYNGPDRESVLSPYRNDDLARKDILAFIEEIERLLGSIKP